MVEAQPTTSGTAETRRYSRAEVRHGMWYTALAWVFGAPFFAIVQGAAFASFLTRYLHTSDFVYGLIMAAGPAAMAFLFFGSVSVERSGRAKWNLVVYTTAQRALWLVVAAIPLWMRDWPGGVLVAIVGVVSFVAQALGNYGTAGWWAWVADFVPGRIAGKYFGVRTRVGMLAMVVVSGSVVYVLNRWEGQPWVYSVVFGVASLFGCIDLLFMGMVREVRRPVEPQPPGLADILTTPWRSPVFRSVALYMAGSSVAYGIMSPFAWRFCFEKSGGRGLGLDVLQTQMLLFVVPVTVMAAVAPFWGRAIDRFGPKPVLTASALAAIIVPMGWVIVHSGSVWLIWVTVALVGLTWPGVEQVGFFVMMKGFPDRRRTSYVAALQVVTGIAAVVGSALGGLLASGFAALVPHLPWFPAWMSHYQPVFLVSIVMRAVVLAAFLPSLQMPGDAPIHAVAKSIAADVRDAIPAQIRKRQSRR